MIQCSMFLVVVFIAHVFVVALGIPVLASVLGLPTRRARKHRYNRRSQPLLHSRSRLSAQVFKRRLIDNDYSSTTTTTTTKVPAFLSLDYMNSLRSLPDTTVWKLQFDDQWDLGDDRIEEYPLSPWTPGYMMLSKVNELQLDSEFTDVVDSQCLLPETNHTLYLNNTTIHVNTTKCLTFDVMLQVVNSISTRLIFTPEGNLIPFEIFATDLVGTLNNMDMESQVMDVFTDLQSVEFGKSSKSVTSEAFEGMILIDGMILNKYIQFERIPNCTTVACFGSNAFKDTASFWTLDGLKMADAVDWKKNNFLGAGAWIQISDSNDENVSFLVEVQNFGIDTLPGITWKVNLSDGIISEVTLTRNDETESEVDNILDQLKSIVETATSITFDLSDVPWSVQINSRFTGKAVLYTSFLGESF